MRDKTDNPWMMYLIVNQTLNMSSGKLMIQGGHAIDLLYDDYMQLKKKFADIQRELRLRPGSIEEDEPFQVLKNKIGAFDNWKQSGRTKISLRADEKEWDKIKAELECYIVRDAGYTEIAPGSETVIGLWPMRYLERPKIIKRLQKL